MEIELTAEQETALAALSESTGMGQDELLKEAVSRYLCDEERFTALLEPALASLERGESVSHEEVGRRLERLLDQ